MKSPGLMLAAPPANGFIKKFVHNYGFGLPVHLSAEAENTVPFRISIIFANSTSLELMTVLMRTVFEYFVHTQMFVVQAFCKIKHTFKIIIY